MNAREECALKGLECCTNLSRSCVECPYKMIRYPKCREELMQDSRDFVRRLKDAVDQFEMVAPSPGAVEDMARENTELLQKIKQLELERDAAISDMGTLAEHRLNPCDVCKHLEPCDKPCERALKMDECFEWRGVCDENGGAEDA